jgi:SPP1 family predicted phage head-tail adaptor
MFGLTGGQFRHQIKIEHRSLAVDEVGQQLTTWTMLATTWAKVEVSTGGERQVAGESRALISHQVTIRHQTAFDDPKAAVKCRISFKGRYLDIVSCQNLEERGRFDVLQCTEGMKYAA